VRETGHKDKSQTNSYSIRQTERDTNVEMSETDRITTGNETREETEPVGQGKREVKRHSGHADIDKVNR
jgi:hypothetical protein